MSKVSKLCLTKKSGNEMIEVNFIEVISNKGIVDDRYFNINKEKDTQITLIESENIDYYNKISKTNIPYINFRRNIITEKIKLNELVDQEFLIGDVRVKGIRLCEPCKYLQDLLKQPALVKKLTHKGGLRCEILSSGKIHLNDKIIRNC